MTETVIMRKPFQVIGERLGVNLTDHQLAAFDQALVPESLPLRLCLYFKTGAGKTLTALGCVLLRGYHEAVVVAPPATHAAWREAGAKLGFTLQLMSHAKFRQESTKLSRTVPVIADEFHLFGGNTGQGWKKLDRVAQHLKAPMILASATPNYNDAERVYCIQHILDPASCRGGFLEFVYAHCETEQNPFGMMPKVLGFKHGQTAAQYLAALPRVCYLPDDLVYHIQDIQVPSDVPAELETYGLNRRAGRIIASQIEERHARINLSLVTDAGGVRDDVLSIVRTLAEAADTPVLVFAVHATVATALGSSLRQAGITHEVVTGGTPIKRKEEILSQFTAGAIDILVGTATLATGTDGMDKICNTLIILDDTDDDSLRRQLVGRIMPRGSDTNVAAKQVHRLVLQ